MNPCEFSGCQNPKVPGHGSKLCQEHRDAAREWREHGRYWANKKPAVCQMGACDEPKLPGRGHKYCAQHSSETEKREQLQIARRFRERTYGVTEDEFAALVEAQGAVCAICGKPEEAREDKRKRSLNVDHDHITGAVRGLLCNRCNPMLGYACDDVAILEAAIAYLKR